MKLTFCGKEEQLCSTLSGTLFFFLLVFASVAVWEEGPSGSNFLNHVTFINIAEPSKHQRFSKIASGDRH